MRTVRTSRITGEIDRLTRCNSSPTIRADGDAAASAPERLSVAISTRLTSLRDEYRRDLENLNDERSSLRVEIEELRQARDLFAEETNTLNKRNTELADLTVEANRKLESLRAEIAGAQKQLAEVRAATLSQSQSQTSLQSQDKASAPAHQQAKTSKEKALPSRDNSLPQGQASTPAHQQQQQHIRKVMSASPSLNSSAGSSVTLVSSQPMSQASSSASTNHALPPTPQTGADEGVSTAQIAHKVDPVASQMTVRKFKCVIPLRPKGRLRILNLCLSQMGQQEGRGAPAQRIHLI